MRRKTQLLVAAGLSLALFGLEGCVPRRATRPGPAHDLKFILDNSSVYCERLMGASLSYTCREKIVEESFFPYAESVKEYKYGKIEPADKGKTPRFIEKSAENEYRVQIVSGAIEESRTQLKAQDEKDEETASPLRTESLFLEPAAFLGREKQPYFQFELEKPEKVMGEDAYVITAHPRIQERGHELSAKIWLSQRDFSVLRIERLQDTLGRYDDLIKDPELKRAAIFQKTIVEFNCEYRDLRFPTFFQTEEYYYQLKEDPLGFSTKRQLRLRLTVAYEDMHFDIFGHRNNPGRLRAARDKRP